MYNEKLCLNFWSLRWLKPNLSLIISFIPIVLRQLKVLLGVSCMNRIFIWIVHLLSLHANIFIYLYLFESVLTYIYFLCTFIIWFHRFIYMVLHNLYIQLDITESAVENLQQSFLNTRKKHFCMRTLFRSKWFWHYLTLNNLLNNSKSARTSILSITLLGMKLCTLHSL